MSISSVGTLPSELSLRTDTRLSGGRSRFASPAEFAAHAVWLMRGASGHCPCKYCSQTPQTVITTIMKNAKQRVMLV